uniref:Putative kinesin n=1 Tax=Trypanosoma congolense (strain IL3000) TaxID=1068625 RepID=G0UJY0_TRYCI|nr:putative kinesin [Trypanosoma congolense IL3000]
MSNIKVAVRCRPLFENERPAAGLSFVNGRRVMLDNKTYDPDYIFSATATQDDVFAICEPVLQSVKDGLHGTVMVYGQSGTGKTHTMLGGGGEETTGIAHRMISSMLDHVQQKTVEGVRCALTLSMVEIYNEKLTDMLSKDAETEVMLVGGFPVSTTKLTLARASDAYAAIQKGLNKRHVATTLMNERSSRSHVVIIVDYEEFNCYTNSVDVTHLFMVDLAGSESLKKSQASGVAAGETGKINKSLLALKNVFLALSNSNDSTRPTHVPYRDSKLTEMLRDSIGGTARTLMIACISSVGRDIEETKSTLMYAVKARSIRNQANNEKEKLMIRLRSFEVENQRLRNRLQERVAERGGYYISREEHERCQQLEEEYREAKLSMEVLLRERQETEARHHISDSQTSILKAMIEDKEEELLRFKQVYHEALLKFDSHVSVIQSIVQDAVRDAHDTAKSSTEAIFQRLEQWRVRALLECARSEEGHQDGVEESNEGGDDAEECQGVRVGISALSECARQYQEDMARTVARINHNFSALAKDVIAMTQNHVASVNAVQERRRASLATMQKCLIEQVQQIMSTYAREQLSLDEELGSDYRLYEDGIVSLVKRPPPADVLPFSHTFQNACHSLVESSRHIFTDLAASDDVDRSLNHINEALRVSSTSASLGAFLQIGNMPPLRPSTSTQSSNTIYTPTSTSVALGSGTLGSLAESNTRRLSARDKNQATVGSRPATMKRVRSSSNSSNVRDSRRLPNSTQPRAD